MAIGLENIPAFIPLNLEFCKYLVTALTALHTALLLIVLKLRPAN